MPKEPFDVTIFLNSTSWEEDGVWHHAKCKVYLDDELIHDGEITEQTTVSWEGEIEDETDHKITVEFYGKKLDDTEADESGSPIEDKNLMLVIEKIIICGIDVEALIYGNNVYYPEKNDNAPDKIEGITHLGWNGTWEFPFSSPVYIWLLENL